MNVIADAILLVCAVGVLGLLLLLDMEAYNDLRLEFVIEHVERLRYADAVDEEWRRTDTYRIARRPFGALWLMLRRNYDNVH